VHDARDDEERHERSRNSAVGAGDELHEHAADCQRHAAETDRPNR